MSILTEIQKTAANADEKIKHLYETAFPEGEKIPWIERYGFTDLYTSSFHPFETKEEYWAYWAKHIWFSRYRTGATELYKMLLMHFPEAFVVTTNVDGQFELAGFPTERIFATQGDYRWFQPASGTPKTLIDNREWVMRVLPLIDDCRIPTVMIPTMPDGSPAAMNLRIDDSFVEDFRWHQQARRYTDFVQQASQGKLLLLEFGNCWPFFEATITEDIASILNLT